MKNLNYLYNDAIEVLRQFDIEPDKKVVVKSNGRFKAIWGRVTDENSYYLLEISTRLLQDDVETIHTMNTVIHELLHCHKNRMCHTGDWKRCATIISSYTQYTIKRTTCASEKGIKSQRTSRPYKYICRCENCGNTFYAKKKFNTHNYTCAKCKTGTLSLCAI